MKTFILICLFMATNLAHAQKSCDLRENDEAVQAINDRFDRAEMSGEDHVIALKELSLSRLESISGCVESNSTKGITQEELKDLIPFLTEGLEQYILEMNQSIQLSIAHDRLGMAAELVHERNLHTRETKKLISKVKSLIKK